jgi:hypothetical protein
MIVVNNKESMTTFFLQSRKASLQSNVMARRKIPPMPIEGLIDHPKAIALPAAGKGMLFQLVAHFWLTECQPLPATDGALFAIARAHRPTWSEHRVAIKAVLADVLPQLAKAFNLYQHRRSVLLAVGTKGHSAARLKALAKANAQRNQLPNMPALPAITQANRAAHRAPEAKSAGFSEAA